MGNKQPKADPATRTSQDPGPPADAPAADAPAADAPAADAPAADDGLEAALEEIGGNNWWMWMMFLLLSSPGVFNIWALTSFVFLAAEVEYWCSTPELESATSWTGEQIRSITTGSTDSKSCEVANFDSTYLKHLASLPFDQANSEAAEARATAGTRECEDFTFAEEGTSIVQEWSLVCNRLVMKSNVQMVVALGKFAGSFILGFVADKWGRKTSLIISCTMYIVAGPLPGIFPVYWLFVTARFVIGMGGAGCYNCAFTLLAELTNAKLRTLRGLLYNMSYPVGLILLPIIAYLIPQWRWLQLATTIPAVLLIIVCWFIPESPRWLLLQDRQDDAWAVVKRANKELAKTRQTDFTPIANKTDGPPIEQTRKEKFAASIGKFTSLWVNCDLCLRLLICSYLWFATALAYYALSINAENFSVDRYWYTAISGVVEAVSYVIPIPILRFVGRRLTSAVMYLLSAAALLCILPIPKENEIAVIAVAMVGRLCIGAVFSVIVLYTTELFPTFNRNTALGLSAAMSHVGGIAAPYIVVQLGDIDNNIPGTICGLMSLSAAVLVLFLPETKGKELNDTVEEMKENALKGDKVTIRNFFKLK